MPTERKREIVAELTEKLSRTQFAVVADYRGMTVEEITRLRGKLYETGAEVIIAKNTLLRIAAHETGRSALDSLLTGPTAIMFAYDDVAATAKVLQDYLRDSAGKFAVRGGLLGASLLAADDLEQVAKMPSRQQVLAEIVGGIQSPLSGLVGVVNAPVADVVGCVNAVVSNVLNVLQARINQLQAAA